MTSSGDKLLNKLLDIIGDKHPHLLDKISVLRIGIGDKTNKIKFDTKSPSKAISGKNVLVFDSVIHTGKTMTEAVTKIMGNGAKSVSSYALAVKRGSSFMPTLWGFLLDDIDRIILLLDEIPNARLKTGERKIKPIHIQKLKADQIHEPKIISGLKSMDRISWGDRLFDMQASEQKRCTYLLQRGNKILGYITVHLSSDYCMMIDEIVVAKRYQSKSGKSGNGFGSILIRFAHTLARQTNCYIVRLFAINEEVKFYERNAYKKVIGEKSISIEGETYFIMERTLLYSPSYSFL